MGGGDKGSYESGAIFYLLT